MGPTGMLLKPFGPLDYAEAVAAYAEQAQALSEGGVDVLVIETHFALDEAQAAVEGARQVTASAAGGELQLRSRCAHDDGREAGASGGEVQDVGRGGHRRELRHDAGEHGKDRAGVRGGEFRPVHLGQAERGICRPSMPPPADRFTM